MNHLETTTEIFQLTPLNLAAQNLMVLLKGWISIFFGFSHSSEVGKNMIKLAFYKLIITQFLAKSPQISSNFLNHLIVEVKFHTYAISLLKLINKR